MSPEKPTPQHDDQTTAELIIAKRLWARSNPGGWPEFGSVAITYANKARELVNELKAAGFEILTPDERAWFGGLMAQVADEPTELGVTKGLPGLSEGLVDLTGSLMGEVLSERIKPSALDQMAPGASEAAQTGMDIANRSIGFVSQKAAEAADGLMEHLDRVGAARFGIAPKSSKWLDDMTLAAALDLK